MFGTAGLSLVVLPPGYSAQNGSHHRSRSHNPRSPLARSGRSKGAWNRFRAQKLGPCHRAAVAFLSEMGSGHFIRRRRTDCRRFDFPEHRYVGARDQVDLQFSGVFRLMIILRDALAEAGIVAFLAHHNKPYTLALSTQASYPELQRGASVLVGGLSNVWTMRVTAPLRFHFVQRGNTFVYGIEDRKHPELGGWNVNMAQTSDRTAEDYALVARIFDQTTGQPVMVVAGLGANGTNAAAEFLLDPERAAELTAHAPQHWQRMNMEAVIRTQILDNHAGPPHLVTCVFW